MQSSVIVGVDVGGTKTLITLFDFKFNALLTLKFKMDKIKSASALVRSIKENVTQGLQSLNLQMEAIQCMGVGCAGVINVKTGIVEFSPNIKFLRGFQFRKEMKQIFNVPVWIENDVNAGLYGEYVFKADQKRHDNVVGIFIGTGIGGAMIFNGRLYRGMGGAGEVGHTWLSLPTDLTQHSNAQYTLEGMGGRLKWATDLSKYLLLDRAPYLKSRIGTDVKKIKSHVIKESIKHGDTTVKEVVLEKSRLIGLGIANLINILHPGKVIVGGGVVEALASVMLPEIKKSISKYALKALSQNVLITTAKLKDLSVVYGAAKLAEEYANHTGENINEK